MEQEYEVGETLMGEVVGLKPYGAFIKLPNEIIGMVHISEVATEYVKEIDSYLHIGDEVAVKIIGIHDGGKYNLSLKDLSKQDEETAHFTQEVREAQQHIEDRKDAILETTWKRPQLEQPEPVKEQHADFLEWVSKARKISNELNNRSQSRQRKIDSIDF